MFYIKAYTYKLYINISCLYGYCLFKYILKIDDTCK